MQDKTYNLAFFDTIIDCFNFGNLPDEILIDSRFSTHMLATSSEPIRSPSIGHESDLHNSPTMNVDLSINIDDERFSQGIIPRNLWLVKLLNNRLVKNRSLLQLSQVAGISLAAEDARLRREIIIKQRGLDLKRVHRLLAQNVEEDTSKILQLQDELEKVRQEWIDLRVKDQTHQAVKTIR